MKRFKIVLTRKQLDWIEVAVRLRAESCEDNDQFADSRRSGRFWRAILNTIKRQTK